MLLEKKKSLPFKDVSYLLKKNQPSQSYGVSIFDIDGDNEPEILVSNFLGENLIYKYNDTTGKFHDVAPKNFGQKNKATVSMCVGDFTGNGKPSVYVLHSDTFSGLKSHYDNLFSFEKKDGGVLACQDLFSKTPQLSNPYAGRSIAAVDHMGSGAHAFYVVNYDAPNLFYRFNSKTKKIEEVSKNFGVDKKTYGRSVVAQYITGQKSVDFFVANEDSAHSFFTKTEGGSYTNLAENFKLSGDRFDARGIAVADFDGNGLADIVVGTYKGLNAIYMQKKPGHFENLPPGFFSEPENIRNIVVADFDNDGNEEIFVNIGKKRNKMFRYLGNNEWEELNIGPLSCVNLYATGAAVGDLTGNGFLDLFIAAGDGLDQKNKLFFGVPNENHWLRIQPMTKNNFPALGAKVRVICKDFRSQTKFICSGSGYLCQMEPVAHFGFGPKAPTIEHVEITWPGDGVNEPVTSVIEGSYFSMKSLVQIPFPFSV